MQNRTALFFIVTSLFWFALADTQWDLGRLEDSVKETAIKCIDSGIDLERWKSENSKLISKREKILQELKRKLLSKQPDEKIISQYKEYKCEWKEGDIYAWQIKKNDMYKEKYIVVIKVAEKLYWPCNICPIVYVYNKVFDKIPDTKELDVIKYLPQFYTPIAYKGGYSNILYRCLLGVEDASKNIISEYIYIGNVENVDFPDNEINDPYRSNEYLCLAKDFEEREIEFYTQWKGVDY